MAAPPSPASALLENEESKPIPPITAVYSYLVLFFVVMLAIAWRAEVNGAGSLVWIMTWMAVTVIRRPFEKDQQANTITEKVQMSTEKALLCGVLFGMYFIPVIFLLTGFPRAADHDDPGPWSIAVASLVTVPALYLFWRSHVDLGRNWSPTTELRENHTLVTTGVYRQVRHPMYTALWMLTMVQPLLVHNWIAGFAPVVSFAILYFVRVGYEEEMMIQQFGDEYRDYCSKTGRLVPPLC
ncbi:unnamed protein product [Symbiodinium sp. CCMP2456]|nr:unnamed protein product [Symbiodinium sp. CCMP2456]